mmetsp:Transcript_143898/g.365291  ORF Transcript_143898/g.365291 Transcript_143898/m.365291 type:complete len:310 (+) Transcript_143898:699-1628(+)
MMARVLHPEQSILIEADLAVIVVHVVMWIFLIVQDLDLLEQVMQLVCFPSRPLDALPEVLHPEEAIGVTPNFATRVIHMIKQVPFVVKALDLLQKVKQLLHLHLTGLGAVACALYPEEAVGVAPDLVIYSVCVVERVPLVVQALHLLQQHFQLLDLGSLRLYALATVPDPKEAICILPNFLAHIVNMIKGIFSVVKLLNLLKQFLQISKLRVPHFGPISCVLDPLEAVSINAYLELHVIHTVEGVLAIVEVLDFVQQMFQLRCPRILRLHSLPCVLNPQEAICIVPNLVAHVIHMVKRVLFVVQTLDIM